MNNATAPYSAARQKFWEALQALVSSLPMRQRLGQAVDALSWLNPDSDLPPEINERFTRLMKDLIGWLLNGIHPDFLQVRNGAPQTLNAKRPA